MLRHCCNDPTNCCMMFISRFYLFSLLTVGELMGSPLLCKLHWLPMEKRIQFKTLLHVFQCLNGIAPPYLAKLFLLRHTHRQGLRSSSDKTQLNTHESRLSYGKHAFSHSAAELWNNLPINVRKSSCVVTFKKKTLNLSLS